MTRLWPQGVPIEVQCGPQGQPQQLRWQGRPHRIIAIPRHWQVDSDWWRERVWRAYYKISTDSGLLLVIYEDLAAGGWYLQRLFD